MKSFKKHTDIDRRSQNSYTILCNGVATYLAPTGVSRGNRRKQNASFMHVYFHAQTTVILIVGKPKYPPIGTPCWDINGIGFGIFSLYLWRHIILVMRTPVMKWWCNVLLTLGWIRMLYNNGIWSLVKVESMWMAISDDWWPPSLSEKILFSII